MDILRDIMSDMQEEIEQLKLFANQQKGIAVWKRSTAISGNIPLNVEHIPSTLDGMVKLSNDKKTVIVLIPGLYRIIVELNYTTYNNGCTSDQFIIRLNGNTVLDRYSGTSCGFGTMIHTCRLKRGDKIVFYCSCMHTTNTNMNSFTVEKL